MTNLHEAVEGSALIAANKGEQFSSFDVNAFEVPGGRDELWRFTPLKRLRGLHDGSAPATGAAPISVSEQAGVALETVQRGDERLGQGGVPADRVAAQAFSSFDNATIVNVARNARLQAPIEIVVEVLSADAVRIQPGMRVLLERWGGPKPLEARVRTIEPVPPGGV